MTVVTATFGALSEPFVQVVDFLLKLPDICDKLEAENLKMEANSQPYENNLLLPGKVPSARMQSFVVSAINEEEVKSFSDFYVFSDFRVGFLELPTLGKLLDSRRHPLVISCELEKEVKVINFVDYSLIQGAPAGRESTETPIGHESNGAIAGRCHVYSDTILKHFLEQAMANLSKVVGDFVGNQEATNAQINQRIDRVENFE
ncbi:hypothetical protein AAG906_022595 [Vitis piasezkii]